MFSKKWFAVLNLLAIAGLILSACATPTPTPAATTEAPPATTEAPAAPATTEAPPAATEPAERPGSKSKDPSTFVFQTFGDPNTLDPHILYDTASSGIVQNIIENLVTFDGADPNAFVPLLAESIPDPVPTDAGGVSYTWTILDGVKFHAGGDLEAHDVAYSFWRSMLLGDPNTPAFLILEAFFDVDDASQIALDPEGSLVGDPDGIKAAPAADLAATCEAVKAAVVADDAAGTVTMNLVHPWGPFLATLAGGQWAGVVDQEWQTENGDWDGDCATWQNFYGIPAESGLFRDKTNGTGPYMLDHWTPEEEVVLVSNPDYRNGEPAVKRAVIQNVTEFGTRFAALQAGDADSISLGTTADRAQMDTLVADVCDKDTGECETTNPDGILRTYPGLLQLARTDIYLNFNVGEDNPYIGSGALDGEGVPPDFFSDVHVRRAFNYCFDYDTYIQDVQLGDATKSLAITLPGELGYEGSPAYSFDLAKCEEEFKASTWAAEDGTPLWDTGFYLQILYNAGNTQRQAIAEILSDGLQQVNPAFFISPVALPWPTYLRSLGARQLPLATSGWQEDIHDPHNWYVPYLIGTYGSRFNVPQELKDKYAVYIAQGVGETDPAARAEIYSELNQLVYEDAPLIVLSVQNGKRYEPLYLHGWFEGANRNPLVSPFYFADFTKD
jgi:peptide/nickel transport system substrate-binding protein